jgi:hypothetical protein
MAQSEQEMNPATISHIGLDLTEGVVSLFGAREDGLVRFRFYLPPALRDLLGTNPITERSVDRLLEAEVASVAQANAPIIPATTSGKVPTVTVPGKLQTKPKEGRADRHHKPTAWAQLLAHLEGRDGATLLSTSFHGRTRDIALGLNQGDQITAQGYLHLRAVDAPDDRLSSFSVIHLLRYPGKPTRGDSQD